VHWGFTQVGDCVAAVGAAGKTRSARLATAALMGAASLGVVSTLAMASADGAVLRVAHRTAVAACAYARAHGRRQESAACARASASRLAPRAAAASFYQNPVSGPTADPAGINNNGGGSDYYVYATGNLFPIQHSTDLVTWTSAGTAFKRRPSWVVQSGDWNPWAPSVLQVNEPCPGTTSPTCFVMYYVGQSARFSVHCIGVATSTTPGGPFTDRGPLYNNQNIKDAVGRPIGCGDNAGYGNIDPAPFVDTDGNAYLYVSTDRSCPVSSTSCTSANSTLKPTISVMRLGPKRLAETGSRQPLFSGGANWEKASWAMVVEGPWMEKRNGVYHLFYSGGDWTRDYGMGDATLATPMGPAAKDPNNPILHGTSTVFSTGGGSTIIGPRGGDWMLYHARLGGYSQPRQLFIDPVVWNPDRTVNVDGPTTTPQSPAP
jgi:beta-xylosidase